jgi:TadE-like protein
MWAHERGQAAVEFGIIGIAVMILTVGLVDVGRAFFDYSAVSSAARFGARWAGVVGGSCIIPGKTGPDWCTQNGSFATNFWEQTGTVPLQGNGKKCPQFTDAGGPAAYYSAGSFLGSSATSIVGAIAQHFDSSSASQSFIRGKAAGFNLSQLKVCVQTTNPVLDQVPGDYVSVTVYYHFNPINFLVARGGFDVVSTSQYVVEG